jgi:calcineurin-like phosphoesterase family protein
MAPPSSVVFKEHTSFGALGVINDNEKQISMLNHNQSFNVVVAGDFGCGKNANKTVSNMVTKQPEIVIALGDLSYNKLPDCWFDLFSPLDTDQRIRIAIGDNEIFPYKYTKYLEHFNMTKPYYSFDYNNAHFLAMATAKNKAIPYLPGSDQYKFVNEDLKRAQSDKKVKWIIVFQFRTFYSSNTTHPGLDELQDTYHPLFEKYGVDVVLQAHNHNYQRTYPILYNNTKTFTPIVTNRDTESYLDPKGQIFVTVGTGGQDLYNFTGQAPYTIKQFERHGFLDLNFTDNGSKLIGTFYENRKLDDEDHFTMTKK